jgi:tetratricopeptide (TPR) repeat protein
VSVDDDWNYVHNLMYAIANRMEQGRLEDANALSDRLAGARGQLSATLYVWSARDQIARVSRRLPVALRIGDWQSVLAMLDNAKITNGDKATNLRFLKDELRAFATGMKALDDGELSAAQAASAVMDAGLWRQQQDGKAKSDAEAAKQDAAKEKTNGSQQQPVTTPVNPDANPEPLVRTLSVASMELRAGALLLQGNGDAAKKMYTQAIAAEKKLGYHEPPLYIRPVAETEAEALLRAKDYAGARAAFQAALGERPQSGFELYGIARADELAGNLAVAKAEYRTFLKAWPSADRMLPEMVHAREALGDTRAVAAQ